MSKTPLVAVLMGGMSSEHEISLCSGVGVVAALTGGPFCPIPVTISKTGEWSFPDEAPLSIFDAPRRLRDLGVACVFIALHGAYGEDGRIQALLDLLGLPYTGSGCGASALAMDKVRSKAVVGSAGIPVAPQVVFDRARWDADAAGCLEEVRETLGFPCVIKPASQGSSVGVEIVQTADAFLAGVPRSFQYEGVLLVEQFVRGRELTCAVYDAAPGQAPYALPVTEIRPKTAAFFDYEAKYQPGASEETTPADIGAENTAAVQRLAERAHILVGCEGWSRSDFILGAQGPVWIEINTVPGLTPTSLYPQAAKEAGITYAELMVRFIRAAIARGRRQ